MLGRWRDLADNKVKEKKRSKGRAEVFIDSESERPEDRCTDRRQTETQIDQRQRKPEQSTGERDRETEGQRDRERERRVGRGAAELLYRSIGAFSGFDLSSHGHSEKKKRASHGKYRPFLAIVVCLAGSTG